MLGGVDRPTDGKVYIAENDISTMWVSCRTAPITYQQIVSNFTTDRKLEASRMSIDLLVGYENSVKVKEKICPYFLRIGTHRNL